MFGVAGVIFDLNTDLLAVEARLIKHSLCDCLTDFLASSVGNERDLILDCSQKFLQISMKHFDVVRVFVY